MPSLHAILFAFLLPACLCGAILLASARLDTASERSQRWNAVAGAWAFGIGYGFAHVELAGLPAWPSAQRTPTALDWLGWSVLLAIISSTLFLLPIGARKVLWIVRTILSTGLVVLSLRAWSAGPLWVALFLALAILVWTITDALVERSPGPIAVLPLFVAMFSVSVSALLGHSALIAELAGATCTCMGAAAVVARLAPRFQLSTGAVAVFMLVFAGVLFNGVFFSDLHWSSALCSCLALLVPWIPARSSRSSTGPWKSAAVRAAFAAVLGFAAIVAAHLLAPSYGY